MGLELEEFIVQAFIFLYKLYKLTKKLVFYIILGVVVTIIYAASLEKPLKSTFIKFIHGVKGFGQFLRMKCRIEWWIAPNSYGKYCCVFQTPGCINYMVPYSKFKVAIQIRPEEVHFWRQFGEVIYEDEIDERFAITKRFTDYDYECYNQAFRPGYRVSFGGPVEYYYIIPPPGYESSAYRVIKVDHSNYVCPSKRVLTRGFWNYNMY